MKTLVPYRDRIHVIDTVEIHDDEVESYEKTTALLSEHPEINALFFAAGGVYGGCRSVEALERKGSVRIIAFDLVTTTRQMLEMARLPLLSASSQNSGQQTAFPAVRLSDHRRDSGEGIQLYRGGYPDQRKSLKLS